MATVEATPGTALPPGSDMPALLQTILFLAFRRQVHARWRRRYGDVFTSRVAGDRVIVTLSQPEHIRQVFAGAPTVFHAGEGNGLLVPVMGKHSLLTTDEDEHLRARKLLMPAFNGAALRGYRALMTELAVDSVERWPVGTVFPVHPRMNAVTLEIILRVVFGMADGPRLAELRPRLRRISDIGPLTVLGWSYPKLRSSATGGATGRTCTLRTACCTRRSPTAGPSATCQNAATCCPACSPPRVASCPTSSCATR